MTDNLCTYIHPKWLCGGNCKDARKWCKFFPRTNDDCPDFNQHGCHDCGCITAQFEAWALVDNKPD